MPNDSHDERHRSDALLQEIHDARVRDTRVTCVLASALMLCFGAVDVWAIPSALAPAWIARAAAVAWLAGVFALTHRRIFDQCYAIFIIGTYLVMGGVINGLIYLAGPADPARELYFVGLLLVIMGLYTWVHLHELYTTLLAAGLVFVYATIMIFHHGYHDAEKLPLLSTTLVFLTSATVIGLMSQHLREGYLRENRRLRFSLQEDLLEEERARRQSQFDAEHDRLTGLPNRTFLERRVPEMFGDDRDSHACLGLLFLDLDGFKPINDTYGHVIGDEVLKLVAMRLKNVMRRGDIIARFGGDEFVAVLKLGPGETDVVHQVARKLADTLATRMRIEGREFRVTASIGVALSPRDGTSLEALLTAADRKMYYAKQEARLRVAE